MKKSIAITAAVISLGAVALVSGYVVNRLALGQSDDYDAYDKYNS